MAKLTPWFPASVKPVREGVYRTRFAPFVGGLVQGYAHWNGDQWALQERNVSAAFLMRANTIDAVQAKEWRGLASPPKGQR